MAKFKPTYTIDDNNRVIDDLGNDVTDSPIGHKKLKEAGIEVDESIFVDEGSLNEQLIAAIVAAGNGFLPVGEVQSIIGWVSPEHKDYYDKIIAENPNAAKAGLAIGSVIGLIGGPIGLAKAGGKAAVVLGKAIAGGRAKGVTRGQIDRVKSSLDKKLKKAETDDPDLETDAAFAAKEAIGELDQFDNAWESLTRQKKLPWDAKQDIFRDMIKSLSDVTSEMAWLKKNIRNPFETIFTKEAGLTGPVTGGSIKKAINELERQIAFQGKEFILNLAAPVLEGIAAFGTDFAANWLWAYANFRDQGWDETKAKRGALIYAWEKTPEEVLAEIAKKTVGRLPVIGKALGVSAEVLKGLYRTKGINLDTGYLPREEYQNLGGIVGMPKPMIQQSGIMAQKQPTIKRKGIMRY